MRPRRCHAAPSGGCAQREAVHAPEDPIKDHYQFNTLRRRDSGGPGRAESSSVLVLRPSPQRISVSSPREGTRIIASCFRSKSPTITGSRVASPHTGTDPCQSDPIPGEPLPPAVQLYSVQCTTLDGPARRSDATRSPIPGEPLTLGSSRMPHVATRESMFTLTSSSALSSLLATYSAHSTQQTQPSIPLRPLRHVTSNGQDGARSCSISPDSHPAPAVPECASRTPGPSRQSRRS